MRILLALPVVLLGCGEKETHPEDTRTAAVEQAEVGLAGSYTLEWHEGSVSCSNTLGFSGVPFTGTVPCESCTYTWDVVSEEHTVAVQGMEESDCQSLDPMHFDYIQMGWVPDEGWMYYYKPPDAPGYWGTFAFPDNVATYGDETTTFVSNEVHDLVEYDYGNSFLLEASGAAVHYPQR